MPKSYLLIDFGASRIKSAICKNGSIVSVMEVPSVKPIKTKEKCFEISSLMLKKTFCEIVKEQYKNIQFEGILLCSEMHGFILVDKNNKPLSNYISWKDERCLNSENIEDFNKLRENISDSFFKTTGMNFRACYPITKVKILAKELNIKDFKVISLTEWLACCSEKSLNIANITMSASLGFYNINDFCWDENLLKSFEDLNISFNKVSKDIEISGYITIDNNIEIPIYTGIGDLQAAIIGAGYGKNIVNLNLGTGSQVVTLIDRTTNFKTEVRPFVDNTFLSVITHIPSGRALNTYVKFLESINSNKNFWGLIDGLNLKNLEEASLNINLGVFSSAWNFLGSGVVDNILENNFSENNFISSLIKSYLKQYDTCIENLFVNKFFDKIILSGGIAKKIPVVKKYFEKKYEKCSVEMFNSDYDTTLLGLSYLSDKI